MVTGSGIGAGIGTGKGAVMEIADLGEAIAWQASHSERAGAPRTAMVIRGELAVLGTQTRLAERMRNWPGLSLEDALPLRLAGGLHWLCLSGSDDALAPVYAGTLTDQAQIDAIVAQLAERHDDLLTSWLDGPPQTNEAGRSAGVMAALLWLSGRLGLNFEMNEIGASAGINTMMDRYHYDLGGVEAGPDESPMRIAPEWRGPPPPKAEVAITALRGCDVAPIDITDPEQSLRLKAYIWADATERMVRMDAAIALANARKPDLVQMDAGQFVAEMLARPQAPGVTRVLFHTVMWQYLPQQTRAEIITAMEAAGAQATPDRPLAWVSVETNRQTFRHEIKLRYWPGGDTQVQLGEAHPHGAWVEWQG